MTQNSNNKFTMLTRLALCTAAVFLSAASLAAKAVQVSYAQLLADYVAYNNADVLSVGIHAVAPGATDTTLVATNAGEIGAKSDAGVLAVIKSNKSVFTPQKDQGRYQALMPLFDDKNNTIGALSLVLKYDAAQREDLFSEKASAIRNFLQKITPYNRLFDPYTKGYDETDTLVQKINQILLARHPDVNVIAFHLTKEGEKLNRCWGLNRPDFIGRNSDEIDTDTEKTGRIVMQVIPATHRMEVHMPLLNPKGDLIGTICTVYFWQSEGEAADFYGRSLAIMHEARILMPENREDLFKP